MSRMSRMLHMAPRFVEFIPNDLEDGVLYVSIEYRLAMHRCCCGCGERVATPFSPAQWNLTFDGETVSLSPSIGNISLDCRSHYFITHSAVRWMPALTGTEAMAAAHRDRDALVHQSAASPAMHSRHSTLVWGLRQAWAWLRRAIVRRF